MRLRSIAIALLCMVAACSVRVERNPDVMVSTLNADPTILNPVLASDANASSVTAYIYESLIERDNQTLEEMPRLAERWDISNDGLTFTFYLRKDVKWQDGKPFSADDVIYTFNQIMDPKVDSARLRNYFRDVKKAEKIDDYTVRFTFAYPYFRALQMVGGMSIIPKHLFDTGVDFNTNPLNRTPLGTGPYRFKEWVSGSRVILERNEDYWREKPRITGIVYKIIADSTVLFQLLKKGAIDTATIQPIQWVRQTESKHFNKLFRKYKYYPPNRYFIAWNHRKPYFSDKRVRRALTLLINRKEMLDKLFFGQGILVTSTVYRFGPNFDPNIKPLPYDPAAAVKLLDEAGWVDHDGDGVRDKDGVKFEFDYLMRAGSKQGKSIGLIMRQDLGRVGIEVNIRQLEGATMFKLLNERNYDSMSFGWVGPPEDDPYQVWHSTQMEKGSNVIGFQNKRIDEIVEQVRREFDPEKRKALLYEFQEILYEEQPYTFLYTLADLVVLSQRFIDVKEYPLGLDMIEWGVKPGVKILEW